MKKRRTKIFAIALARVGKQAISKDAKAARGSAMLMQDSTDSTAARNRISLRRREMRDAEALFAMFNQPRCQRAMVLEPFGSADEVQAWCGSRGSDTFDLVATINDTPVGFAGLYPCAGSQSHSGWISLFVHDAFHGRGIGTTMMRAIIATSELLAGLTRLQLIVFCDNEPALSLYCKFGFKFEGRHECFARRGDAYVPAFTMARIAAPAKPADPDRMREAMRDLLAHVEAYSAYGPAEPADENAS
jgi:putative acetyltransferase